MIYILLVGGFVINDFFLLVILIFHNVFHEIILYFGQGEKLPFLDVADLHDGIDSACNSLVQRLQRG